jgi:hypothetical protein
MNPFLLSPSERLAEWRNFRQSLKELDEMEQLERVAVWVSRAPTSNHVLDVDSPKDWPGPWDLLNEGDFDNTATAYLMEQTLLLSGWDASRLRLHLIRNHKMQEQLMILLVDDKWALNYSHAEVFNFDKIRPDCAYLLSYQANPEGGHTEA